jgi:hypothetical protein
MDGHLDNYISSVSIWTTIDGGANWSNTSLNIKNLYLQNTTKTIKYTVPTTYTSGTVIDLRVRADFNYADDNGKSYTEINKIVNVQ